MNILFWKMKTKNKVGVSLFLFSYILILTLLCLFLEFFSSKSFIFEQHKIGLIEISNLKSNQVDDFFKLNNEYVSLISVYPPFIEYFNGEKIEQKKLLEDINNIKNTCGLKNIILFKNSTIFKNSTENLTADRLKEIYKFYEYMKNENMTESIYYLGLQNNPSYAYILKRFFINDTEMGFILLEYSLDDLKKIISAENFRGIDNIYLLNKDLISIFNSNKSKIDIREDKNKIIESFNSSGTKIKIYKNENNEKIIICHKYLPKEKIYLVLDENYNNFEERHKAKDNIATNKIFFIFLSSISLLLIFIINKLYLIEKMKK